MGLNVLIIGDPRGRDDEGMKRVNRHLQRELCLLGHNCQVAPGLEFNTLLRHWDRIVFTAGPSPRMLGKIAFMRLAHPRAKMIMCGLMPSLPLGSHPVIRRCIDRIVSDSPYMQELAKLNDVPITLQTAATFSFANFQKARDRERIINREGPLKLLHVGHLNKKRNVFRLAQKCSEVGCQLNFLVSSTEAQDRKERARLEGLGVTIVDEYQEDLFEFYRQFDIYAFPVERSDAAIAMPLSVIEALLAGLSVVATDFGELKAALGHLDNVAIVDTLDKIDAQLLESLASRPIAPLDALMRFDTGQFARSVVDAA